MADDDRFEPRLGHQRQQGGRRARRYLGRVLAAANLARGGRTSGGRTAAAFSGSRTGRGAGIGSLLASRSGTAASHRRVIVKARIVRLAGTGAAAAAAHLRYLERDGTTREGDRGTLYGREADAVDARVFAARGAGDRHQFRFIVSAEDGAEYDDLKPLTRRLMARIEEDLGTRLDWVAVDHFNTGHPHTHIVVRGKDDRGDDLILARAYLTRGIRERAAELVDLDLGPRTRRDIERSLRAEVEQERLTAIDRALLARAGDDRIVTARAATPVEQSLQAGRLARLQRLGLADPLGAGRFRLAPDLAGRLRALGERGDIIRTMQRDFTRARVERAAADRAIYDPAAPGTRPLVGRVLARGLADEHADRHYLVVDALDGRSHYVAIGRPAARGGEDAPARGAIVRIDPVIPVVREADRVVAAVAAANHGHYDIDAHLRRDPAATQAFAEAHVRRLEAIRRLTGGVEREPSGRWIIAPDHLERAAAHEAARAKDRPVAITLLSAHPLEALVDADAATWLDRTLAGETTAPIRDAGFGRELNTALARRRQWLVDQGFADAAGGETRLRDDLIAVLRQRELRRVADQLAGELGRSFRGHRDGEPIEGLCRRRIDLISGQFALIEKSREFTLIPWRPVLDRHIGKTVSGIVRGDDVSWTIGRGRSGPSIP